MQHDDNKPEDFNVKDTLPLNTLSIRTRSSHEILLDTRSTIQGVRSLKIRGKISVQSKAQEVQGNDERGITRFELVALCAILSLL